MTDGSRVFPGFSRCLEGGYTQFPNEWFEICQRINNLAELKIVLYVIRHTWGYRDEEGDHEEMKTITTDEFAYGRKRRDGSRIDRGTELGLTSVKEGIKRAITHRYLVCDTDNSDLARIEKSYGLNFLEEDEDLDGQNPTTDGQNVTINSQNPASGGRECDHRSEKETSETNPSKETMRNIVHSQFFEETMEYIKKKEEVTFYELERFLHRFMRVRGNEKISFDNCKDATAWDGISNECCKAMLEVLNSGLVKTRICSEGLYRGRKPKMPAATMVEGHEGQHWHPEVIYIKE